MNKTFDLVTFKIELEKYMNGNRLCNKNALFQNTYKTNILTTYKLVGAQPMPGLGHYWWILEGKIYDPTIHQFTTLHATAYNPDFVKKFPCLPKIFDEVYKNNDYYDQSNTCTDINAILVPWYNGVIIHTSH